MKITTAVKSLLIIGVVKFSQSQPVPSDQPEQANGFSVNYSRPAIVLPMLQASASSNSVAPNTTQQGQNYALTVGGTPILGSRSAQLKLGSLLTGNQPVKPDQQSVSYETKQEVPQEQTQVVNNQVIKQNSPINNYEEKVSVGQVQFAEPQSNQVTNVNKVVENVPPVKYEKKNSVGQAQYHEPQNNQLVTNVKKVVENISPVKNLEKISVGQAKFAEPQIHQQVTNVKKVVENILPVSTSHHQQASTHAKLHQHKQPQVKSPQQPKLSAQPQQPHPVQEVHVQVAAPSSQKPERSLLTKLVGPPSIGVRAGINLNFS
ncbi:hypothetical protein TKK_0001162 [Trichogramma kaykai]|uniref:Uncharacterized protein n=1 Tax=Trichogramma kaykai TaxID=54128 RepID=A0ABD2VVG1_9HYME